MWSAARMLPTCEFLIFGKYEHLQSGRSTNLYGTVEQRFDCRKVQKEKKWLFWERDEPVVSVKPSGRHVFGSND